MLMSGEQAAYLMFDHHPAVGDKLKALGLRYGITCSRSARLAGFMLGLELPQEDDFDLQVHLEDFGEAVDSLDADVEKDIPYRLRTGDGKQMHFTADNALARVGDDTIQFMRIRGGIVYIDNRPFNTSFTDEAYHACTNLAGVNFTHDSETATLYGLRRGEPRHGKYDRLRAAAARAVRDPETESYAAFRAQQVGWDYRLRKFDADVARQAARLRAKSLVAA